MSSLKAFKKTDVKLVMIDLLLSLFFFLLRTPDVEAYCLLGHNCTLYLLLHVFMFS